MVDASYRWFAAMMTSIVTTGYHGATNADTCKKYPQWCAWIKSHGKGLYRGTGCLAGK